MSVGRSLGCLEVRECGESRLPFRTLTLAGLVRYQISDCRLACLHALRPGELHSLVPDFEKSVLSRLQQRDPLSERIAMLFLDTEFTDLPDPELLSIGMVSIKGAEFYAELDMTSAEGRKRRVASSDLVQFGGVLDLWSLVPGSAASSWEMAGASVNGSSGMWRTPRRGRGPRSRLTTAWTTNCSSMRFAMRAFGTGFERLSARATSTA